MDSVIANLHIHTVLSPCADILMTPKNIIEKAVANGLDMIAIADHNSAKNIEVALKLSADYDLTVIPAMEVESKEEVHLLSLFPSLASILSWQDIIDQYLPDLENDEDYFGPQLITDKSDDFIARETQMLAMALELNLEEIVKEVTRLGGIVIPAHIDRSANGILSNLGFIPPDLDIFAVEIADRNNLAEVRRKVGPGYAIISNSDAHYLPDIVAKMELKLESKDLKGLLTALKENNRQKIKLL